MFAAYNMSLRLLYASRSNLHRAAPSHTFTRQWIRLSSTSTPPPPPPPPESDRNKNEKGELDDTPVQKTLAITKAYLERAQSEIKPRLEPYIHKINNASEQLKRLTSDVSDSKEALRRASLALNELTGYDQINAVKQKVDNQGNCGNRSFFTLDPVTYIIFLYSSLV